MEDHDNLPIMQWLKQHNQFALINSELQRRKYQQYTIDHDPGDEDRNDGAPKK